MKYIKWQWAAKGLFFGLLFISVANLATMLLWNHLAAPLFGLPLLSFFQSLGLMVLGRLLTGGFRPRGRGGWHRGHMMRERWKNMSQEQREALMNRWGKRGWSPEPDENKNTAV